MHQDFPAVMNQKKMLITDKWLQKKFSKDSVKVCFWLEADSTPNPGLCSAKSHFGFLSLTCTINIYMWTALMDTAPCLHWCQCPPVYGNVDILTHRVRSLLVQQDSLGRSPGRQTSAFIWLVTPDLCINRQLILLFVRLNQNYFENNQTINQQTNQQTKPTNQSTNQPIN